MTIRIRPAVSEDIPVLRVLIDASVRGLQSQDYTPSQIENALATVYGVDTQLIADESYFVAEESSGDAGDSPAQCSTPAHRGLWRLEQTENTLWRRPMEGPRGCAA
jgi:hypothetical protein